MKVLLLSRHLPHFRSTKFTVLAIGGALCVATAASVTAATWPSASAAPSPAAVRQATAGLTAASSQGTAGHVVSASDALASQASRVIAFQRVRFGLGARVVAIEEAQARAAATRARLLAARAHSAHVMHQAHLAALAAAARAASAARAAARQQAAQQATQQQATTQQTTQQAAPQPTAQPPASTPSGSPQQIAAAMLVQFGWGGQFSCLDSLWAHESGWNPYAQNPSSGAYGIPQALPGSKMGSAGPDWASNPATQIRWGLEYIQGTYGSPCGAWSHEESTGWY